MKISVFDNYDSFTYNLVHLVEKIMHQKVDVYRNDQIELEKVKDYDKIILSPGPGIPSEAGLLLPLIREYAPSKSILGVCLGHQAIGEAFGGMLMNLSEVYHGVATPVEIVKRKTANGKRQRQMVEQIHVSRLLRPPKACRRRSTSHGTCLKVCPKYFRPAVIIHGS